MRLRLALLLATLASFFLSGKAMAQSGEFSPDNPVARISYNLATSSIDWRTEGGYPQSCFALYPNGYYQVSRMTEHGMENLQGTLSHSQLLDFGKMLGKLDFEGNGEAVVRVGSDRFVAEVLRGAETLHYMWMNPDNRRPFPDSASRIVEWLKTFGADGASPLMLRELSQNPICPKPSFQPLRPMAKEAGPILGR